MDAYMKMKCEHASLSQIPDQHRCAVIPEICAEAYSWINIYYIYFCTFDQSMILMSIFVVIFLFLWIRVLDYAADGFISSALQRISGYMNLSESLAGVTVLAFANGATDVITSIIASRTTGGTMLAIGALFGASSFAINVILASIIFACGGVLKDLDRGNFKRDITTFFAGVAISLVLGFYNQTFLVLGLTLSLIYFVFLIICIVQESKAQKEAQYKALSGENNDDKVLEMNQIKEEQKENGLNETSIINEDSIESADRRQANGIVQYVQIKTRRRYVMDFISRNLIMKIFFFLEMPLYFLIDLTLPPVEKPLLFKGQIAIYPFTTVYFILFVTENLGNLVTIFGQEMRLIIVLLPFQTLAAVLLFMMQSDWKPRPRVFWLLVSSLVGIQWLGFLVDLNIDLLNFIKFMTGLSSLYMGLTILGIGNSCVDLFVDNALAAQGFEIMALTGLFAGQMFNYLVGFGLGCVVKYFSTTEKVFHIFDSLSRKQELMSFSVMAFSTIIFIIIFVKLRTQKELGMGTAIFHLSAYCGILCWLTYLELTM